MKRKALSFLLSAVLLCMALWPFFSAAAQAANAVTLAMGKAFPQAVTRLVATHKSQSPAEADEKTPLPRFFNRRLILQTAEAKRHINTLGAETAVANGEGRFILQYATMEACAAAYAAYKADAAVAWVLPEGTVSVSGLADCTGAELLQSDRYANYLARNGKTAKITVAVIDTGLDLTHPMFAGRLVPGYDFYNDTPAVTDGHGHGTHVSGIIADNTPKSVKIMPLKALGDDGSGPNLCIAQAVDYAAAHGADIINMSLGGDYESDNDPIAVSVRAAVKKGVAVVVSAGNENQDVKNVLPAGIKECVTVAAYMPQAKSVCDFSNWGSGVDVTAPGSNILSAAPGGGYQMMSGTSQAAPFAAAAAAMLKMNDPSLSPAGLETALRNACSDILLQGNDVYSGAGLLNFGMLLGDKNLPSYVTLSEEDLSMRYFSHCTARYTHLAADLSDPSLPATDLSFTAVSANPKVAVFDGKYIVPKGPGKTDITVKAAGGHTCSVHVTVTETPVWIDHAAKSYAGGKGTKKEPYLISTPEQLSLMALTMRTGEYAEKQYFRLTNDIDLAGRLWITATDMRIGLTMLGYAMYANPLRIDFNGANHKIKNMHVFDERVTAAWFDGMPLNRRWYDYNTGLFGMLIDAAVYDLGVENAYAVDSGSGLLCETASNKTVLRNCYTTGFSGGAGLVTNIYHTAADSPGEQGDILIENCYSAAAVLSTGIVHTVTSNIYDKVTIRNTFFCGKMLNTFGEPLHSGFAGRVSGANTSLINCFSAAVPRDGAGLIDTLQEAAVSGCCSVPGVPGVRMNEAACAEIREQPAAFFRNKKNYTDPSVWSGSAPWDFGSVWTIKAGVNGGCPYFMNNPPAGDAGFSTGTWLDRAATAYAGGTGEKQNPYRISNASQLALLALEYRYGGGSDVWFSLTADIDLAGLDWSPLGMCQSIDATASDTYHRDPFMGSILGNGHTIRNMRVASAGDDVGFICRGLDCCVENLNFENAEVTGREGVGVLFGKMDLYTTVANCTVSGLAAGDKNVGCIAGSAAGGTLISGCTANCTVRGEAPFVGGIAGKCAGTLRQCAFTGTYDAADPGVGFVSSEGVFIAENCYSLGGPLTYPNKKGQYSYSYIVNGANGTLYAGFDGQNRASDVPLNALPDESRAAGFDFGGVWQAGENALPTLRPAALPVSLNAHAFPAKSWADAADTTLRGEGTEARPYLIATAAQLAFAALRWARSDADYLNAYYSLIADIDLSGKLWVTEYSFSSDLADLHFDGRNHTVSGLTMKNGAGLFGCSLSESGEIKNLRQENVRGTACSAFIVSNMGTVENCSVSGTLGAPLYRYRAGNLTSVSGDLGAFAESNYGNLRRCDAGMTLTGGDRNVGGLAGYNGGLLENCFFTGALYGEDISKLSPGNESAEIRNCYSAALTPGDWTVIYYTGETENRTDNRAALTLVSSFTGWDFKTVWDIASSENGGMPFLRRRQPDEKHTHDFYRDEKRCAAPDYVNPGVEAYSCARCLATKDVSLPKLKLLLGDVDCSGSVTTADARLALRCAVGLQPDMVKGTSAFLAGDADRSGSITTGDARRILRAAVGLEILK